MSAPARFSLAGKRVYVAGHRGMVGSALMRRLAREDCELLGAPRAELDLTRQSEIDAFFASTRPDVVVVAAARVGGILANATAPADFLRDNLLIQTLLIDAAFRAGVEKLLFLGSSCIYPRAAPEPIVEAALLTAPLETTNEAYAIAKIAGLKLCEAYRRQHGADFIAAMPCNLYGPGDNFHPTQSHVIPALMRRFDEAREAGAREVVCWGTGAPRREFLHVDDLADACAHLLKHWSGEGHVNVGAGVDMTIRDLAGAIRDVVGFEGDLVWDASKPDGVAGKRLDVSRMNALGWRPSIAFADGLAQTFDWYRAARARGELRG